MLGELRVGNLEVEPPLIIAPMSGVTGTAFRQLIRLNNPNCVGLSVTEFISVEALTRKNTRSIEMLSFAENDRPIAVQVFGHSIERMIEAAKMAEQAGADIIDINSGCPVPKVVKRGGGCELMRQPQHFSQIVAAVSNAVRVPVTVKIRSGWDPQSKNAVEIAKIAEEAGAAMVVVHPRTRTQMYSGEVDLQVFGQVCEAVRIPVIASGDIVDGLTATRYIKLGAKGLMIGRGALLNPWIFSDIIKEFTDQERPKRSGQDIIGIIHQYLGLLRESMPDKAIIGRLKQLGAQVTRQIHGSQPLRKALCQSHSLNEFCVVLDSWQDYVLTKSIVTRD